MYFIPPQALQPMGRPLEDQTRPLSVVLPQIDGACEGLAGGWNARSCAESLELSLCAAGWEAHALCEAQTRAVLGCTKKEIVRRPAHSTHAGFLKLLGLSLGYILDQKLGAWCAWKFLKLS